MRVRLRIPWFAEPLLPLVDLSGLPGERQKPEADLRVELGKDNPKATAVRVWFGADDLPKEVKN